MTGEINRRRPGPKHFVARLTNGGRLDRKFGRAAVAAASSAYGHDGLSWEGLDPFPQGREVELFAPTFDKTTVFRVGPDGHLDPRFGSKGETRIDLAYAEAAPAGGGRLFVLGYKEEPWYVRMVDRDGHLDRRFGRLFLPGAFSEYGMSIFPDGPGRAIVVSPGESLCAECENEPRIYRLLD